MAQRSFYVYKCLLHRTVEATAAEIVINCREAQERLGKVLHHLPPMFKKLRSGEEQQYTTLTLRNDKQIYVLSISDPKNVELIDNTQSAYDVVNFPPAKVIFDNRDGICQMVIEHRSDAFSGKPDKLRDVLEGIINQELAQYHLAVEINVKKRVGDFWEIVNESRAHHDRVKGVKFTFPNRQLVAPVANEEVLQMSETIRLITEEATAMNAFEGVLQYNAKKDNALQLKNEGTMSNMVALCAGNGYDISVFFEKYGEFKYGDEQRLVYVMNDLIIEHYIKGDDEVDAIGAKTDLEKWLDEVYESAKHFDDAHTFNNHRKKRDKKLLH